ncbi:MAG: hypothetical protein LBC42_02145 [Puniceicoccales bacterium]|jgi:hypothetical protein|nr:hypothetical protein [Puniceicoccales bacterium]
MIDFFEHMCKSIVRWTNNGDSLSSAQVASLATGLGLLAASVVLVPSLGGSAAVAYLANTKWALSAVTGTLAVAVFVARALINWEETAENQDDDEA